MCDIWKGNHNLKQLNEQDLVPLMKSLRILGTKQVVMSGGEALLHPGFFGLCKMIKNEGIKISLLSTGLLLQKHIIPLLQLIDDIIISLDGNESVHDSTRNIPGAYRKLRAGVKLLKSANPSYPVTARTVIHRLNYRVWDEIIESAIEMGVDQISFLPADLTSEAFNREEQWTTERQSEIALSAGELPFLKKKCEEIIVKYADHFKSHFIAESPSKFLQIYQYYSAVHGLDMFPYKKCNAPWVSTVVEPDGSVRPCFFHPVIGNIRKHRLEEIINSEPAIRFRKSLDMNVDPICKRCVCSLNLSPRVNPASR
jgi:Fe-coproporphyrin III synthase